MHHVTTGEWRQLLRLVLAQRLEINAIGSALRRAKALMDVELKKIAHRHWAQPRLRARTIATTY
jgi:hypothetical protein